MTKANVIALIIAIGVSEAAGLIGMLFTADTVTTWYPALTQPVLTPPNWLFGPVWVILYALMGVAAFLVWRAGIHSHTVRIALLAFGVQLILNAAWSVLFFGLQSPGLALIEIVLLWCAIVWTLFAFARVSRTAAYLLLPYLLWTSFAVYLNAGIWLLN